MLRKHGIAALSASGGYGPIKVGQGIVGHADVALGDRVEPVTHELHVADAEGRCQFVNNGCWQHPLRAAGIYREWLILTRSAADRISTCGDAAQFFACFPSDRSNIM
jgi:hypothetical protein